MTLRELNAKALGLAFCVFVYGAAAGTVLWVLALLKYLLFDGVVTAALALSLVFFIMYRPFGHRGAGGRIGAERARPDSRASGTSGKAT